MKIIEGALREYAWGSRTALASLRGSKCPADHPEAELWFGAHPGDPSPLVHSRENLLEHINQDVTSHLGKPCVDRFEGRLPFLMKLLSADDPLSLQAHPSKLQAEEGFARENAEGIPLDASNRNYKDNNHKPEIVIALTDFQALAGFRPPLETAELFRAVGGTTLTAHSEYLSTQPDAQGVRSIFTTFLATPAHRLSGVIDEVATQCLGYLENHPGDSRWSQEAQTTLTLIERYPGDAGVLSSLLLNRVTLSPGQALYLDAGNLHAYLSGTAVEVMANSDNVLRGGLTPKHVDISELMRVLDFEALEDPVLPVRQVPETGWTEFDTPACEFKVSTRAVGTDPVIFNADTLSSPQIIVVSQGSLTVQSEGTSSVIHAGQGIWISAHDGPVSVSSDEDATIFRTTVGNYSNPSD